MDQQHPVPQQISSYQFRLVGDMTLKQFLQLAGGALLALLVYSSSLPVIFKLPLIVVFVLLGAALAFLPFENRPLEQWIVAFFRAIYSPTEFYWQRTTAVEQFFQEEKAGETPLVGVIAPHGELALKKYLEEKPSDEQKFTSKLEEIEKGFLSKVGGLFGQTLSGLKAPFTPQPKPTVVEEPAGTPNPTIPSTFTIQNLEAKQAPIKTTSSVAIPKTEFIRATPPKPAVSTQPTTTPQVQPIRATQVVAPVQPATVSSTTFQAPQFSLSASPPAPPTQPNTISGQTLDASGKIIEGAILEIKDAASRPVRAVKTNKLGHFYIVTPLSDGVYEILTEKDGFEFDPIRFNAEGAIIPPIAVRAKGLS